MVVYSEHITAAGQKSREVKEIMDLQKTIEALKGKGYGVSYFETAMEAAKYLNEKVDHKTVGFGDSVTLSSMAL